MKRIIILLMALCSAQAWAASKTITTSGTDCSVATRCLVVTLPNTDKGGATFTISGTWTGTIQFEVSGDGGATWVAAAVWLPATPGTLVTSATANGTWQYGFSGMTGLRMRASATVTGSAVATITPSTASARNSGSSGGGLGTVTSIATTTPITGGTITATGTIACATCVTSAAALTSNSLVIGGGLQATSATTAIPNGITATTQTAYSADTKVATDAYVDTQTTPIYSLAQANIAEIASATQITGISGSGCSAGTCTIASPATDTNYRINHSFITISAGSGGTCTTGSVRFDLTWTDADTSVSTTAPGLPLSSWATSATVVLQAQMVAGTPNYAGFPKDIRAKGGTSVTYILTQSVASNCTTKPVFTFRPIVQQLGSN